MDYASKKMDPWERIVPPFHFDPEVSFVNIVVPTVDTVRYSYLLDKLLAVNTPVMFTGATGGVADSAAKPQPVRFVSLFTVENELMREAVGYKQRV